MRIGPFGPRSLVALALVLAAGLGGWFAFDRYIVYLPRLVQDIRDPVRPFRPVAWERGPETAQARGDLPNIVLIVADDLGWNDISLHGGLADGTVATPNIDRLARDGVQLTQAYAASATCAPSRAALMTGRYPTRFGYEFTPVPNGMGRIIARMQRNTPSDPPFIFHPSTGPAIEFAEMAVPGSEITIAELLREAGYHNVHIGKWHMGATDTSRPNAQGFDESLDLAGLLFAPSGDPGVVEARQAFDPIDQMYWIIGRAAVRQNGGERFTPDIYLTDYFTREAVNVIEANRNRPFFLYLAHWAVHSPLQARREDYEAFAHIEDHALRVYAAMTLALDRSVGEVLDALEANGLSDNTLVIFTSDNGGAHYIGLPGLNDPYRGWKATFFDGGIRVPTFLRWPGVIAPESEMTGLAQHIDLLPTIAAIAGVDVPQDRVIDGRDLMPFLTGETSGAPHETLFWRSGHYRAVIHQGWKLQISARPDRVWLFDLENDPGEQRDLSAAEPERVATMMALLEAHEAEQADPLWPSLAEMPVTLDTPLGPEPQPDADHVYWPN